jgi:antitoxin component YwqK of YwqJK toxin-antitoxin module
MQICNCPAQSDTINKTDSAGLKQGWWIIKNDIKKFPNYPKDVIVEEGRFFDGKKEGVWKMYYPNGKIRCEITYVKNRPEGFAKMYFENGCINEQGFWKNHRWVGEYISYYDRCNAKFYLLNYNKSGKMDGMQYYFNPEGDTIAKGLYQDGQRISGNFTRGYPETGWGNGQIMMRGEIDTSKSIVEYYENGDTNKVKKKIFQDVPDTTKDPPFGKGHVKLYNSNKQLSKEGVFKNYKLIDGKEYIYNKDGVLIQIAVYKNGKYVGDSPLEEKDK